jgi:hypothetical protein
LVRANPGQVVGDNPVNQLCHTVAAGILRHEVGPFFQLGHGITYSYTNPAHRQECVIILGVANGDSIVCGNFQMSECGAETGRFVDRSRENHDGAFIKNDLQLETDFFDEFDRDGFIRFARGDDGAAHGKRLGAGLGQLSGKFSR